MRNYTPDNFIFYQIRKCNNGILVINWATKRGIAKGQYFRSDGILLNPDKAYLLADLSDLQHKIKEFIEDRYTDREVKELQKEKIKLLIHKRLIGIIK